MRKTKQKMSLTLKLKSLYWKVRFNLRGVLKRTLDIGVAMLALLVLFPLLLIIAVLIKLESKGPVLFKQNRIGLNGLTFEMWKFRSMVADAEELRAKMESQNEMKNGVLFKIKRDPRITRVGSLIRKASIDELPQLINVIKGDMSLVGPRPSLPQEVEEYSRFDCARLSVLPGITCFWQVQGRSDIPFERQVALDVEYIETQSLVVDLAVLLKTIPAVLSARGAY